MNCVLELLHLRCTETIIVFTSTTLASSNFIVLSSSSVSVAWNSFFLWKDHQQTCLGRVEMVLYLIMCWSMQWTPLHWHMNPGVWRRWVSCWMNICCLFWIEWSQPQVGWKPVQCWTVYTRLGLEYIDEYIIICSVKSSTEIHGSKAVTECLSILTRDHWLFSIVMSHNCAWFCKLTDILAEDYSFHSVCWIVVACISPLFWKKSWD